MLAAWNTIVVALHKHFGPLDPSMPWGALLARIEWLYADEPIVRAQIDAATK